MMTPKSEMDSQTYRQQPHSKPQDGNDKAARMTPISPLNPPQETRDRLQDAIQTYSDYFIRY